MMDPRVKDYFKTAKHAGHFDSEENVITQQIGSPAQGEIIALSLKIIDGQILDANYRILGGPYLFAALEFACEKIIGKPVSVLSGFSFQMILEALDFPAEKRHCALLVEDLIQLVFSHFEGAGLNDLSE